MTSHYAKMTSHYVPIWLKSITSLLLLPPLGCHCWYKFLDTSTLNNKDRRFTFQWQWDLLGLLECKCYQVFVLRLFQLNYKVVNFVGESFYWNTQLSQPCLQLTEVECQHFIFINSLICCYVWRENKSFQRDQLLSGITLLSNVKSIKSSKEFYLPSTQELLRLDTGLLREL